MEIWKRIQLRNKELELAAKKVDRSKFLPKSLSSLAYDIAYLDSPIQVTGKHSTTALSLGLFMLDQLELRPGNKVLEVGTGTGYYTAIMAEMGCQVTTLENDDEMYDMASSNLKGTGVVPIRADGSLGYLSNAPYDRVILWAAAPSLPCAPFSQLRDGGIMVAPIKVGERQYLYKLVMANPPARLRLIEVLFSELSGFCGTKE
jgi:protein-L-isoaspartate(D-aspartate) O-methyltransferase